MKETFKFLKERTQVNYIATIDGDKPSVRPFGDPFEYDGKIYILTNKKKNVYKQMITNNKVCIVDANKISNDIMKKYNEFDYLGFQSTPIMITNMIKKNLIGITPKSVVKDYLDDKKLFEVKNNLDLPTAKMYITYNKKLKNKTVLAVCDFFREHSFYDLDK